MIEVSGQGTAQDYNVAGGVLGGIVTGRLRAPKGEAAAAAVVAAAAAVAVAVAAAVAVPWTRQSRWHAAG